MPLISALLALVPASLRGHRTRSNPSPAPACDGKDVVEGGGAVPCSKAETIAAHEQPKSESSPPLRFTGSHAVGGGNRRVEEGLP